jgi:hypothetical protein
LKKIIKIRPISTRWILTQQTVEDNLESWVPQHSFISEMEEKYPVILVYLVEMKSFSKLRNWSISIWLNAPN